MSDDRAALEELADRLWDQRRIVTFLLYRLTISRLLLAANERRFAPEALREVDRAVELLRDGELRCDESIRGLAELWQVTPDEVSLPSLATRAPPPFDHTFTEHLAAFRELTSEVESASCENQALARAELEHLTDSIVQLTGTETSSPTTCDANGRLDRLVGLVGEVRSSRVAADAARSSATRAQLAREAEHGVSIEEEMVGLVRYQRALEAAARAMTTVDQALETLVNRVGIVGR